MSDDKIKADYLVVTWIINDRAEAHYPVFYAKVHDGAPVYLRGYTGRIKEKVFFGRSSDRFILEVTGSKAHEFMRDYDFRVFDGCSFARLDLQATIEVPNADHIIIQTRPSKVYRSFLTYSLNGPGATLYVGAPSSRVRLRVYNKSAESGVKPDPGHDYLRIELQLRDYYADRAAAYFYASQCNSFFRTYIAKMSDAFITDVLDRYLDKAYPAPTPLEEPDSDWIARRYAWLEHSVTPAIVKLALNDPDGVARYLKVLIAKLDLDVL